MKGLPSRFATGNFFLAVVVFLMFGLPFFLLGITVSLAYVWGPFAFYVVLKLHRSRVKRHKILSPPSYAEFTYNVTTALDKLQSDFDDYTWQVSLSNATAGGK
jgi:hypothetical protein